MARTSSTGNIDDSMVLVLLWPPSLPHVDKGEAWPSRHPALQAAPLHKFRSPSKCNCRAVIQLPHDTHCRWRSGRRRSLPAPQLLAASTGRHGCTPTNSPADTAAAATTTTTTTSTTITPTATDATKTAAGVVGVEKAFGVCRGSRSSRSIRRRKRRRQEY